MASLRDKLRATAPVQKPQRAAASDCFLRETAYPLQQFLLPEELPGNILSVMEGFDIPDMRREELLFLDTETTGLSGGAGTVAFLVGLGVFEGDAFIVRQYLMRDYDEEVFVMQAVAQHLQKCRALCTFNGRSFDMPLLQSRFTMQRMRMRELPPHIDLLHIARRVWKLRLKRCSLAYLEEAEFGMPRSDDLPGALVPQRYFDFLKTREFSLLEDVLRHNAQDIVSLAHVLHRLMALHEMPLMASAAEDVFSLGRVYERRGDDATARMCYRAADKGAVAVLAKGRLADNLRRARDYDGAAEVYQTMLNVDRPNSIAAHIALAKLYEHKLRDYSAAMEYTRRALILCAEQEDERIAALQQRYKRLLIKTRRE